MEPFEDEDRITVTLRVSKVPQSTKNAVLANFKCGLPDAIKRSKAEFALYGKGSKKRVLMVEDVDNKVCYYGKRRASSVDQTLSTNHLRSPYKTTKCQFRSLLSAFSVCFDRTAK